MSASHVGKKGRVQRPLPKGGSHFLKGEAQSAHSPRLHPRHILAPRGSSSTGSGPRAHSCQNGQGQRTGWCPVLREPQVTGKGVTREPKRRVVTLRTQTEAREPSGCFPLREASVKQTAACEGARLDARVASGTKPSSPPALGPGPVPRPRMGADTEQAESGPSSGLLEKV